MKTPTLLLSAVVSAILFASSQPVRALELPNDLTQISSADAPIYGTYWSIAYWPDLPPLPFNGWDLSGDLYYSPSLGSPITVIWVDDRALVAGRMLTESSDRRQFQAVTILAGQIRGLRQSRRLIIEPIFGFKSSILPTSLATLA